ncbi:MULTISPECIES: energy-coupling factor transporter transmembrane component T family protein [Gemella]|uniref:energy-coupling factor transporter transmembrane component T family protein n=1 Tax=Gemella TaxID=1378 RepID=UPI000768443E|nr:MULTISPECIES: energy-coupling factor transporter transmembrane component T [Gemella]AME09060.1 ABC transporter permease [Gemella sp. oral taxon 928]AXI26632.1 energy-coupling factor transporter transmembrane protein EcfT [Gemella sp. ND 6198]
MNNSLISKYIPLGTVIHNLDPRLKLFFVTVYLVDVFIATDIVEFLILFIILIISVHLSKTTLKQLIFSIKSVSVLIFFTSLIHLVFNRTGEKLIEYYGFVLYSGALYGIILITCRFSLVVMIMIVFMMTTSPTEITHAIEKSLGFLNKIGVPISTFALVLSISLRFIPTILEEANRIINAQVSRGSDFNEGNILQKTKKIIPILIPLFIATLKRADELATAMEVRGYNTTAKRTRYKVLHYQKYDYLSYVLIIAITIFIVIL